MATEDDLRRMLGAVPAPRPIDTEAVIRASRRRRLPAKLGAGAVGVLAIAGIGVLAVPTIVSAPQSTTMSDSAPAMEGGSVADSELQQSLKRDPYAYLTCGAPVPDATGSMYGLEARVEGSVLTVTNASGDRVTGTFGVPSVTVVQGGVTVSHSGRAVILIANVLDLAPGESLQQPITVPTTACEPGLEEPGTAPLPAGDYDVLVSLDFVPDVPDPDLPALTDLVVSPPVPLRID